MRHDGNGWTDCARGHRHWGRHGAAGLLLHAVDDAGVVRVLLQHRAAWSHHGDTWGLPGGARDSHEDAWAAALREAAEEAGLDVGALRPRHEFVDDHGGWSYTTVFADLPQVVPTVANGESHALDWVPLGDVDALALHPGFAATWPAVRARPTALLVDVANVMGARPDGWWRDRPGAAGRLLGQLAGLRGVTIRDSHGGARVIASVHAVLEGAAVAAPDPGWVRVHRAPRGTSGDDVLVAAAEALLAAGQEGTAVTADRELRARWAALVGPGGAAGGSAGPGGPAGGAAAPADVPLIVEGPRWLLDLIDREAAGVRRAGPRTS